jgi:hypothetical protein
MTPTLPEALLLLPPPLPPLLLLLLPPHAARAPRARTPTAAKDAVRAPTFETILLRPPGSGSGADTRTRSTHLVGLPQGL